MALEWGLVDQPSARKVHRARIPRLGGVAIFGAFFISSVAIIYHDYFGLKGVALGLLEINKILDGAILILLVGVYDDLFGLSAMKKLAWQVVVAAVMISFGYLIQRVSLPGVAVGFDLGWFAYPVTVLWIVAVMNALNLIDGLDGLAAGLAIIATVLIAAIALINGQRDVAFLSACLIGSLLGFWFFNMHPASIFMGDSGSLFLGYILAVISIRAVQQESATIAIGAPLLLIGLPLLDTGMAFLRRLVSASGLFQPGKRFRIPSLSVAFQPDRGHIHHRLLVAGFTQRQVVLLLYAVATFLGISGFLLALAEGIASTLTVAYVGFVVGFIVIQLRHLTTGAAQLPLPAGWRESVAPIARNLQRKRLLIAADSLSADEICRKLAQQVGPEVQCVPPAERAEGDYFSVILADCSAGDAVLEGMRRECSSPRCSLILFTGGPATEAVVATAKRYRAVIVDSEDPAILALAVLRGFDQAKMSVQIRFLKIFSWLLISLVPIVVYFSLLLGTKVR
jgi:UDP-GlcNAc:undecaprenyl-phosphate GlcNAc-1-phosphate transferase